jgi:membrane protein
MPLVKRVTDLVARIMKLKPVRVFQTYTSKRGPILASGLAYSALFSIFASIWVLFSVAGLLLAGDQTLQDQLISGLNSAVPGIIDTGDGNGAVNPDDLLKTQSFSWTGAIALIGGLATALGFLASARDGIREIYGLPAAAENFAVTKLKDLAFLIGFAVVILISTALAIVGTAATGFLLGLIGVDPESPAGNIAGRIVSLALVIVINSVVVGTMLRLLARARIHWAYLRPAALVGGVGTAVLTVLFQLGIVGGAGANPLIGSFIVILGLLIFFNFMCQVLLISASWAEDSLRRDGVNLQDKHRTPMPRGVRPSTTGPRLRKSNS